MTTHHDFDSADPSSIQDSCHILRRNPIEDGAISGFSGQKSVPSNFKYFTVIFTFFLKLNT